MVRYVLDVAYNNGYKTINRHLKVLFVGDVARRVEDLQYEKGTMRDIYDWNRVNIRQIKGQRQTYNVIGNMNSFQANLHLKYV